MFTQRSPVWQAICSLQADFVNLLKPSDSVQAVQCGRGPSYTFWPKYEY